MSSEPRMRGRRFARPVVKRRVAKEKRGLGEEAAFPVETAAVDFDQVRFVTLNSLEHLGNQRFPLPPFSEHYQRWVKDVLGLMTDFEAKLPPPLGQQFKASVQEKLSELESILQERARVENDLLARRSDSQQQLSAYEDELSKLDGTHKTGIHETRRKYEQSLAKLRSEITTLDTQRLALLHSKTSFLQRLFRKPKANLEAKSSSLQSKKTALAQQREVLEKELKEKRTEYERKRGEIQKQIDIARSKLEESKESKVDDALDLRKSACEALGHEVESALAEVAKEQGIERT